VKGSTVDLITPADAARLRGVTRSAITDLVKRGRLRSVDVAGRPFLYRSEVEKFTPEITGRPPKPKAVGQNRRVEVKPGKKSRR
jgi:excisionase family DNA binding protein